MIKTTVYLKTGKELEFLDVKIYNVGDGIEILQDDGLTTIARFYDIAGYSSVALLNIQQNDNLTEEARLELINAGVYSFVR